MLIPAHSVAGLDGCKWLCCKARAALANERPPSLPAPQRLTGSIPDMSQLPQLQALQLHNNGLSGGLPPMPEAMRNLNLEYNRIRYELQSI